MRFKHGHSLRGKRSPEYCSWVSMRQRCNNPNTEGYHRYGGRGIKVCKRWDNFELFLKDMGKRPSKFHSIHRVNNNSGYKPSNCVWATAEIQNKGKIKSPLKSTRKYRGVNQLPSGRYAARILNCHIGTFDTEKEAALAFNKIARSLYKKNACLNVI